MFKGQSRVSRSPKRRFFKLILCPFKVRGEVCPEKQLAVGSGFAGKQFEKVRLNKTSFMVFVFGPGVGKHQVGVPDLNGIGKV